MMDFCWLDGRARHPSSCSNSAYERQYQEWCLSLDEAVAMWDDTMLDLLLTWNFTKMKWNIRNITHPIGVKGQPLADGKARFRRFRIPNQT